MPTRILRFLCVLGLFLTALPATAVAQTTADSVVMIGDNFFDPADLSITGGTTVTWINQGNSRSGHTVTSLDGLFDAGPLMNGESFSFTFDQPGDYPYRCTVHQNQEGVIHVAASQPGVSVGDNFFAPADFSVTPGTAITWSNDGVDAHTVTSFDGLFNSGNMNPGDVFTYAFPSAGDYRYFCLYHAGQEGTIHVVTVDTTPSDTAVPGPAPTSETPPPPPPPAPLPPAPTPTATVAPPTAPAPTSEPTATSGPSAPMTSAVTIQNFSFAPGSVTVGVGGTVTWTNQDGVAHTATGQGFNTGNLNRGQSGSATLSQAGTFPYHCNIHPNMTGTISVVAGGAPPNTRR